MNVISAMQELSLTVEALDKAQRDEIAEKIDEVSRDNSTTFLDILQHIQKGFDGEDALRKFDILKPECWHCSETIRVSQDGTGFYVLKGEYVCRQCFIDR